MEDILASIRRILSEDEAAPQPPARPAEPPAAPAAAADPAPDPVPAAAGSEPLDLTEDMLVSAPAAPPPEPAPLPPPPPAIPKPAEAEPQEPETGLLAPAAAAAAAASVGQLLRAVAQERSSAVYRGGPTIEDVVREEVRPLLKAWLDANLPPLVERLVRAEIERVVGRALSQ
ncbi:DUF2497 domain-containing protein [Paracraurococcus lichenis]|uniref:DUF2497 domain-containing protein n=1 Tax=Paracraurococcus lichenis TaxID=3064888 RepID=A0ABT9DVB8_9PROT|nr:DUF2497 domain-containing protein [Paracraurococcus sp. LOR1-02]MDO9707845.1 DUF2497 domain-containing protein [Paracraurococcus sp. LOR1-02]